MLYIIRPPTSNYHYLLRTNDKQMKIIFLILTIHQKQYIIANVDKTILICGYGGMADASDSKSDAREGVWVQVPLSAVNKSLQGFQRFPKQIIHIRLLVVFNRI